MRLDATRTTGARNTLGLGLVVSLLATVIFAAATAPLVIAAAPWGIIAATIVLSMAAGLVAAVNAALLLEPKPADATGSYELAA